MAVKLGVIMDPIDKIKPYKDTTFAMLLAAQQAGWPLYYMEPKDLYLRDGLVQARMQSLEVMDNPESWFQLNPTDMQQLADCDVILMRKDPPFNMEYIYTTYLLELVHRNGTLVINHPQSLRDANEKLFTAWFPDITPATLVTCDQDLIKNFLKDEQDIILKPLDGMAGQSIFRLRSGDPNINVTIEWMTQQGKFNIMAQRYLPDITAGDKRIILIDGEPIPYALARIPSPGETRANLAVGGQGIAQPLSSRDYEICERVKDTLRSKGLMFVGLDVIGDYLTEINVTSPTCAREIDTQCGTQIGSDFINCIKNYL